MSVANRWNPVIDRGATWRRTMRFVDSEGDPLEVNGPAFMDIRTRVDRNSSLIARLDTTGNADGDITFGPDSNQVNLLIAAQDTEDLTPGSYYFDVFVSDSAGDLIRLVFGEIEIRAQVSAP